MDILHVVDRRGRVDADTAPVKRIDIALPTSEGAICSGLRAPRKREHAQARRRAKSTPPRLQARGAREVVLAVDTSSQAREVVLATGARPRARDVALADGEISRARDVALANGEISRACEVALAGGSSWRYSANPMRA